MLWTRFTSRSWSWKLLQGKSTMVCRQQERLARSSVSASKLSISDHSAVRIGDLLQADSGTCYSSGKPSLLTWRFFAVLRAGAAFETGLKRVLPDCRTGRLLIQSNVRTGEPELHYLKLPEHIESHDSVLILDPQVSSATSMARHWRSTVIQLYSATVQHFSCCCIEC